MADNFYTGVRHGDEIVVSIGKYTSTTEGETTTTEWVYEKVSHREGFDPDIPEDTMAIFDGLEYKGDKKIQVEKTLSISQAMPSDYSSGLFAYEDLSGLVIKEEIVPNDGSTVEGDSERFFTNVNLRKVSTDSVPNSGEFNITVVGRYNDIVGTEPSGSEDWIETYE